MRQFFRGCVHFAQSARTKTSTSFLANHAHNLTMKYFLRLDKLTENIDRREIMMNSTKQCHEKFLSSFFVGNVLLVIGEQVG